MYTVSNYWYISSISPLCGLHCIQGATRISRRCSGFKAYSDEYPRPRNLQNYIWGVRARTPLLYTPFFIMLLLTLIFNSWHFGALTKQGKLLTWGRYSSGALGHGFDYNEVGQDCPQIVEALDSMFIISAGFGGNHSGCIAFPLH